MIRSQVPLSLPPVPPARKKKKEEIWKRDRSGGRPLSEFIWAEEEEEKEKEWIRESLLGLSRSPKTGGTGWQPPHCRSPKHVMDNCSETAHALGSSRRRGRGGGGAYHHEH